MKKKKEFNLFQFLKNFDLTTKASEFFKKQTDFSLNTDLPQRKLGDLGRAIGRIVSAGLVIDLAEKDSEKI